MGNHDLYEGEKEIFARGKYFPDMMADRTIAYIERNKDKPFFVYVPLNIPHFPEQADAKFNERYKDYKMPRQSYARVISTADDRMGRIIGKLEELKLRDDTIIIFMSDNGHSIEGEAGLPGSSRSSGILIDNHKSGLPKGFYYCAHGGGGNTGKWVGNKGTFLEGGIRVPAIISYPRKLPKRQVRDQAVTALDWLPTIAELCGAELPKAKLDGKSLMPIINSESAASHNEVMHWQWRTNWAVREGSWKLINGKQGWQLGNLNEPKPEVKNHFKERPGIVKRLQALHDHWSREVTPAKKETRSVSEGHTAEPRIDKAFFNGKDLTGWNADNMKFWSVKDGAIVGSAGKEEIHGNQFLWFKKPVEDFRLTLEVKQTPYTVDVGIVNAGIQFRSRRLKGSAHGYQADVGKGWWGKLYHEHGRGILARSADVEEKNIKREDWNHYEILAVDHRIWLAINGKLCVAVEDPQGELSGRIAFQIHGGPPQTVQYRNPVLTHNPQLELVGLNETQLLARLTKPAAPEPAPPTAAPYTKDDIIVADGLAIEPFALEQLSNPCSIDVDDRGRVWVGEAANYRKKSRKEGDRILILEDTDGDGQTDSTKVFYQNPDIDGVHGVCTLGNKVIVSAPDRILLLTDTDGDDKADKKKLLFMGKVIHPLNGQHDHAIHAVMFGPDGLLYFNFGNFNAELRREDGSLVKDIYGFPVDNSRQPYQEGMVIRCEMDGSRVEVLGHNFRNNWEVTVDSFGSMWQSDNDNSEGCCRVNFVMEHGNYGYRDERTGADYTTKRTNVEATMQRQMWHQNDPGVVPNLLITGFGAPTGILVYEGSLLPEQFHGQMIHAEPGRNTVWAFPTQPDGAGYSAKIVHIARSEADRNYRPCDVSVAPDGSLFIADWYDPVDCCHRTLNDAGRLFRVAPPGHVYSVVKYDYDSPEGAVAALRSPNLAARYKTWTALVGMKSDARPALQTMLNDSNPRFRARALWVLAAIDDTAHAAIELALGDESNDIRALALRIARRHRLPIEPVVKRLVRDKSPLVRRECAVSLHRLDSAEAVGLWTELAVQYDGKDRWYLEALGIGEVGKETACLEAWQKKLGEDWKAAGNRNVVWRSRAPEAATLLADLLLDSEVPAAEHPRLIRALDFHDGHNIQAALTTLLTSDPKRNPVTWLEAFKRATPEFLEAHPEISDRVGSVMLTSKGTVTFVDLVARFDRRDMVGHLIDMTLTDPEKVSGIRAVGQIIAFQPWDPIWKALADPDRAAPFIRALGYINNEHAKNYLSGVVTNEAQPEATRLLAISSMGNTRTPAVELMHLVQQQKLPQEFLAPAIRALTLSPDPDTRLFAANKQHLIVSASERWPLEKLLGGKPNTTKGFAAFEKGGCINCHKIGDQGRDFGPALSAIGSKLTPKQLFSAILKPSETISLGYESTLVLTDDGRLQSGFVATETKETLTLRIPGGLKQEISKKEIELRKRSDVSLMPKGIDAIMMPQELVDLVGWLATRKSAEAARSSAGRRGPSQGEAGGD